MTVTLNELALTELLDTPQGPVGLFVQQQTAGVLTQAKANAVVIMHRYPQAVDDIDAAQGDGNSMIIGVRPNKSIADYLAKKAAGLVQAKSEELFEEGWLVAALRGFGS